MASRRLSNRCAECHLYRQRVDPPLATCKPKASNLPRLCDLIDPCILDHLTDRTLHHAMEVQVQLRNGELAANAFIASAPFPDTPEHFVEALCQLHRMMFAEGLPSIAGRFRLPTEPATFGGDGAHRLDGVHASLIVTRLYGLHRLFAPTRMSAERIDVAHGCAQFLEAFFRIHPFVDGNGRVGRLVIRWACEKRAQLRFRPFSTSGRARRRYFQSLQYAHRHAGTSHDPLRNPRFDPYIHLAFWLYKHFLIEHADDEDEQPPE